MRKRVTNAQKLSEALRKVRLCYHCNTEKAVTEFGESKKSNRECKSCHKKRCDKWIGKNRDRVSLQGFLNKRRISFEDYIKLLFAQNNQCFLCRRDFTSELRGFVDHCHITNRTRGLLCRDCNSALGFIHENPETAYRMAIFLEAELSYKEPQK